AFDGPAIVTPDRTVTYPELAGRIDRLARVLRGAGLEADQVCAIALDRGPDAVAAMVAVLRAGGAFLTVDTELPAPRIAALTRGADMLLTDTAGAGRLAEAWSGPTVLVDDHSAPLAPLPAVYRPRSLAYVSHTSGSKGEPNGVMIERRAIEA